MILQTIYVYLSVGFVVSTILVFLAWLFKRIKGITEKEKQVLSLIENWKVVIYIILAWPSILFFFFNTIEKEQEKEAETPRPESDFVQKLKQAAAKKKIH